MCNDFFTLPDPAATQLTGAFVSFPMNLNKIKLAAAAHSLTLKTE